LSHRFSCIPSEEALADLRESWSWCLPATYEVLLVTAFGDVFYQSSDGGIYWLNTGTAETELAAADHAAFDAKLRSEEGASWLLPDLVVALEAEGKGRAPDQCYTYAILPIFAEGKFETWNVKPVPAHEHFCLTAHIHKQIAELPDGAQVKISVAP
jgi:hypothetical protein